MTDLVPRHSNGAAVAAPKLRKKDFQSDQEVRWCPGCGDYAILANVQGVMPELGLPRENIVFVSGIGCAARFPYYMETYGFHSIHGRAPAIATGISASRSDLKVFVVSGDGDALSIGGNHLIHAMRRNANLVILLFNNQIYGLTKGQYSPTSELGKITRSTPMGSLDYPFNPVSVALGAEATFVARSIDNEREHLADMLSKAATHQGTAFIEIYQNCNIFNDGAFDAVRKNRPQQIRLEHGQPIRFGADNEYGVALKRTGQLEIVRVRASESEPAGGESNRVRASESEPAGGESNRVRASDSEPAGGESNRVRASDSEPAGGESNRTLDTVDEDALLVHDAHRDDPGLAFMLSRLAHTPHGPTPIGLFRQVERPVYGTELNRQLDQAVERRGKGDLATLLAGSDSWTVAG